MELPECPVCLQNYDGACTIPRVLNCGHTVCELCLTSLPQRFPLTIRCPACTVLVKYPSQGPSSLPKNIDLLRISPSEQTPSSPKSHNEKQPPNGRFDDNFFPRFWSDEFYTTWKGWILPSDVVSVENGGDDEGLVRGRIVSSSSSSSSLPVLVRDEQMVSLTRVVALPSGNVNSSFNFGYFASVLKCLNEMTEERRDELRLILRAGAKLCGKVCRAYGLWANMGDGFLYLVCERKNVILMEKKFSDLDYGLSKDVIRGFAMIGVEICEAMIALHSQGLYAGSFGLSCFSLDDFHHVSVDLNEVLVIGKKTHWTVVEACSSRLRIDGKELGLLFRNLLKQEVFISPEVFLELLQKDGVLVECNSGRRSSIGYCVDVWPLACVLLRLLIGNEFFEEVVEDSEEDYSDYSTWYTSWMDKVSSLMDIKLDSHSLEYSSLRQILCRCLNFDPESRPSMTELRSNIRELIIKPQFDMFSGFEGPSIGENGNNCCLILGNLFEFNKMLPEMPKDDEREVNGGGGDTDKFGEDKVEKNFIEGLSEGMVKFKELIGHRDCVTGLAVGGNFLFSSSMDKTINVWSLQDFIHVHTFRGHEHKVMALVYADEEKPLCVSADSGGGIFTWDVSFPLKEEPLKKWYEEKDWRYSGIHALAISEKGYLYTGSGDKSIKAWKLKDGTLLYTMNGHKSVVSTLAVYDRLLYSGSWDGTIRLWSLVNHSPLAVLEEDASGALNSVLSLTADEHFLVAAFENGCIKVWKNDVSMKSVQLHNSAIFSIDMDGQCLYTGGWDKSVNVQVLSGDELELNVNQIGTIPCTSVITTILFCQGKLFVGFADKSVKVYSYEK